MRVLIGSLLPRQERLIEADCPAGMELRFVSSDTSPSQWARMALKCDHTVVMTKFISHKHTDALRAAKIPFIMCPGGTAFLKDMLKDIADGNLGIEARKQIHRS